jgi:hypothetical protein
VDDWHIPQLGQGEERSPELGRRDCRRVPIKNGRQVLAEEIEAGVQELMFGDRGQISRRFVVGETLEHFEKMAGNFGAKTRRSDPADPIQDQEQVGGIGLVRFDQSLCPGRRSFWREKYFEIYTNLCFKLCLVNRTRFF